MLCNRRCHGSFPIIFSNNIGFQFPSLLRYLLVESSSQNAGHSLSSHHKSPYHRTQGIDTSAGRTPMDISVFTWYFNYREDTFFSTIARGFNIGSRFHRPAFSTQKIAFLRRYFFSTTTNYFIFVFFGNRLFILKK